MHKFYVMPQTRRAAEVILSVSTLCLLVAGMALINDEVRGHLVNAVVGDRAAEMATIAAPADHLVRFVVTTFRSAQGSDGTLLAFGVAAIALFGFMFRT